MLINRAGRLPGQRIDRADRAGGIARAGLPDDPPSTGLTSMNFCLRERYPFVILSNNPDRWKKIMQPRKRASLSVWFIYTQLKAKRPYSKESQNYLLKFTCFKSIILFVKEAFYAVD